MNGPERTNDAKRDATARVRQIEAEKLVERWLTAFAGSRLRLPGGVDPAAWRGAFMTVAEAWIELPDEVRLPGAKGLRELEKRIAFLGGALAQPGSGATAFDVSAIVLGLRDAVGGPPATALFDWLVALAHAGHAASRDDAQKLAFRAELENGTPLIVVPPGVPAVLFVGSPDRGVVDTLFGRLLLAVVRNGANVAIVDATGLAVHAPVDAVLAGLARLGSHPYARERKLTLVIVGVASAQTALWREASSLPTHFVEGFTEAVAEAIGLTVKT